MAKAEIMKTSLITTLMLLGITRAVLSIQTDGIFIKELTVPETISRDYGQMEMFSRTLHHFALNHSSEYLVRYLSSSEFEMHYSKDEFYAEKRQRTVWQKIGVQGMLHHQIVA